MRLTTRALFLLGRGFYLASTLMHTAAGSTLTLAELRHGIRTRWQNFNNEAFEVDAGLMPWETEVADLVALPGRSVLIAGCGTGREMLEYLKRGCRVTGIEPAPQALAVARHLLIERGFAVDLIEGYVDGADIPGRFDVVLFGWWCYCSIPESARRVRTLRKMAARLNPGGRIALNFDVFQRPRSIVISAGRMAGALARSDWRVEPGDVLQWRQLDGAPFFSFDHAFVPSEIEAEAAAAGLRIVFRRDPPDTPAYVLEPVRT